MGTVPLKFKQILHRQGEKIDTIYFPAGGVCSITSTMTDGRMVEVATVGNEGMVGSTAFFGEDVHPGESMVQVPDGFAQTMSVRVFRAELDRRGPFYSLAARYSQALMLLIMQSAACNRLHSVEERCARWLLMTHDRAGADRFKLTQEFLSVMLGVRRPSVSIVAKTFHKAGLIDYGHKQIAILDRKGLEATSCECYRVIQAHFARLLP
ncbi:MAG: Crp/Fnr family transcriptional regulator [Acidobacteria bacterium]|nr:Crp/Fnr family transcriptional regulator [Acidobacteriota bacterium]